MSRSLIHWNETDELALAAVQSRLQAHSPGRTLSRPDVIKLLLAAAASKVTPESLLMGIDRGEARESSGNAGNSTKREA